MCRKVYDGCIQFLGLPPAAPNPFPRFLKELRHNAKTTTVLGQEFWALLSPSALHAAGFDSSCHAIIQRRYVSEMVSAQSQTTNHTHAHAALLDVLNPDAYAAVTLGLPSALLQEVKHTHEIVTAAALGVTPTINMADLHAGVLSLAEDSSESIAHSLMVFLTGRTIVQDAKRTHDAMLTKAKEWDLQAEVASRLIDSLTQLTFDLQVSGSFDATSTISAINLVEQRVEDGCPRVSISDMRGALRECLSAPIMFALAHQSSNLTVVLNV